MNEVRAAKERVPDLKVLDFPQENAKLVSKLPYYLKTKWRSVVQRHLEDGNFPSFDEFAEFVALRAKEANIPIFESASRGNSVNQHADSDRVNYLTRKNKRGATSFATVTSNNTSSSCPFCKTVHNIDDCNEFKKLTRKERKEFLIKEKLCFACGVSSDHRRNECKSKASCKICKYEHLTCLHYDKDKKSSVSHCTIVCDDKEKCIDNSMILPVWVRNTKDTSKEVLQYCVLDPQSNTCFISDQLKTKLGVEGQKTKLSLSTMHATSSVVSSERIKDLEILSFDRKVVIQLPTVYTRNRVPAERDQIPKPAVASKWMHLKDIAKEIVPHMPDVEVGLLIGNNVPSALRPRDTVAGADDHPYGQKSILGWGIVGMVCQGPTSNRKKAVSNCISATDQGHQQLKTRSPYVEPKNRLVLPNITKEIINPQQINRMFEIKFIEQKSKYDTISVEDRKFMKILEECTHQTEDGHYEMPIPLRYDNVSLPNNRPLALKRLLQQKRRFQKDDRYKRDYFEFMDDMIQQCAERVPEESLRPHDGKVNYVPHTGVYHQKKNKIRVVFDCSAEFQGVCLNDYLLQGPDLLNGLVGVLTRFRKEKIAVIADIKGMFHQFQVREEDRDLLRFLWWKDGNVMKEVEEYRMKVLFGAGSSPACANFGLKLAANDGEEEFGEAAANFVRNDFYVDDGLKSVPTVREACDLVKNSTALCAKAGLKLHKWSSNSRDVLKTIPEEDRSTDLKEININADPLPVGRVLGVTWCIESDCFPFIVQLADNPLTRRGVLATVSSIYDPLGFAAPVLIVGKMILQELCQSCIDWDEPIPEQLKRKWEAWRMDLVNLERLKYKRCYKPDPFGKVKNVEVHYFSDASNLGYGQCTYLRKISEDGETHCSFVIGKARVTPAKRNFTIPRLELTAVVLSAKMSGFIRRELHIEDAKEFFWTDSKVVLGYVNNEAKRFQVFVANRIQQIRDLTSPDYWRYVETESNPSDHASRGLNAQQLIDSEWLTGPQFLWENGPSEYASDTFHTDPVTELEVKKEMKKCKSLKTSTEEKVQKPYVEPKQIEGFSTWYRASRAVANCVRFAVKWRRIIRAPKTDATSKIENKPTKQLKLLSVDEFQEGERIILRGLQQQHFSEEISVLQSLNVVSDYSDRCQARERNRSLKQTSSLYKLDPFIDSDGIIRVGGRVSRADLPEDIKHPIILPKKDHITSLVIRHNHIEVNHMGRTSTHNHIRQNVYWIINGSSAVSQYISNCVICKKSRGSLVTQKMADLPTDRMKQEPPFTYCAVDFFGPFTIKERRSQVKRYGVLFTCMSSRSIHLETANSLETDSFINALRRFINIRGPVKQMRSDCGTNMVGANNVMKKLMSEIDQKRVGEFMLQHHCDWVEFKFSVPSASHMGGVWERLIKTVRSALEPILSECGSQLNDESFRTVISEVQGIVNSRPLTVDSLSDPSAPAPLTPNNILTMKKKVLLPPPGDFQRPDLYCQQRWRRVQHIANEFWQRWQKEFLQTLQPRGKWSKPQRNLQIGDVVVLKDDNLPRNSWKIGKVDVVYPSEDGAVRKVKLMMGYRDLDDRGTRQQPMSYLDRPIHKLVLLVPAEDT